MTTQRTTGEQQKGDYDLEEARQVQESFIAIADSLLALREQKSDYYLLVDLSIQGEPQAVVAELEEGGLGHLLASPDDQLALDSDGSYYPVIDARKSDGQIVGVALRVGGRDYEKGTDHEYKQREFDVGMVYKINDIDVVERLEVSTSSRPAAQVSARSYIVMMEYIESGYEGHNHRFERSISSSSARSFLELLVEWVGDNPQIRAPELV